MSHRGKDLPTTPSQTRLLYHIWGGGAEHINQPGKGCTDTTACREGQRTAEQWQYSSTLPSQDAALVLRITNFDFCLRRSPSLSIPIPHWARGLDGFVLFSQRRGSMSAAIQHEQLANKSSLWQSQEMCAQQKGAEGRAGIPPPSAHGTQQHKEQRGGLVGREGEGCFYGTVNISSIAVLPFGKSNSRTTTAALLFCKIRSILIKTGSNRTWHWGRGTALLVDPSGHPNGQILMDPSRAHLLLTAQHPV